MTPVELVPFGIVGAPSKLSDQHAMSTGSSYPFHPKSLKKLFFCLQMVEPALYAHSSPRWPNCSIENYIILYRISNRRGTHFEHSYLDKIGTRQQYDEYITWMVGM